MHARNNGYFKAEIVPMEVDHYNVKTKKTVRKVIEHDDGIREGTTFEKL